MGLAVEHRHDTTDAEPGHTLFQTDRRRLVLVGVENGLTERGEIIPELLGFVDSQEGRRRWQVELELPHRIVLLQQFERGEEGPEKVFPVRAGEKVLGLREGCDEGAQCFGFDRFSSDGPFEILKIAFEFPVFRCANDVVDLIDVAADACDHRGHENGAETHHDPAVDGNLEKTDPVHGFVPLKSHFLCFGVRTVRRWQGFAGNLR